ncbi:dipeptidyl peptidase IV N-terminal region-domain-containing protein [Mucor mucedo]|uniref:dipeptidyl peptidase IV N-terminal region-domain-containing protein n=1 Tax=Mucor mucedo TaxID=29922 RepID=UPI00221ED51A|nr:dipeptidyl peptidase IV N-terminal region-domain-containing protein [Mucor mucedo]KAI7893265.1 dipeptidyl peptidase IV N-terminal region-domain-containing protein [Mucor mucedo]
MPSRDHYLQDEELASDSQRLLAPELQQRRLSSSATSDSEEEDFYSNEKGFDIDYSYQKKGINCICVGFLSILALAWVLWTISIAKLFSGLSSHDDVELQEAMKLVQFEDIFNSSFTAKRTKLVWVGNDPRDGIYTYRDPLSNDILLESIEDRKSQVFVEEKDLVIDSGILSVSSFELSYDAQYILLKTNVSAQWRHSSRFNAYIYRLSDKKIMPLTHLSTVGKTPRISYAEWSPTGHQMAYVMNNDLYITDLKNYERITFDGSKTVFNGIPDWVYEEEVFGSNFALWWSPDSTHLAYLRLDETKVPEYHLQLYTDRNASYPKETNIRYPKAGAPNPLVSLHVYSLESNSTIVATTTEKVQSFSIMDTSNFKDFEQDDRIIVDVTWATDSHTHLLFKQTNRIQDQQYTNIVNINSDDIKKSTVKLVQEYKPTDGGWIEVSQSMVYLPSSGNGVRYIDILDNSEGYPHLAIITFKGSKNQVSWLTTGEWEVVSGTVEVDEARQLIHYVSTERSPYERHLYTISFKSDNPASTKICLTCPQDPEEHAYYSASFSPKSGYYILNYEGPGIPTTIVKKVDDSSFRSVLDDNNELRSLLNEYDLPKKHMKTINSGGVELTAMEMVPHDFDSTKKYPVLFHVYGGPGSQLVSHRFELDWQTFVASQLGFIVVTVDGRGTGFQGRKFKVGVRGRLGELETIDQVNAGRHWAKLDYVDEFRMAIWGWSYGGYMTTKVVEANDGVFSTGMAVAPVTDWRYYDSVYTERYMKTPLLNPQGYIDSAVNNMTGFRDTKYLLAHGTGDDNVHFQHTAVLVDKLTLEDIHNYRVQIFPDSNHAIRHHNANKNVYYLLTDFLLESFGGHEYKHIYGETGGKFSGPLPHED